MHTYRVGGDRGYTFWIGTLDGHPVVDVGSGELDESIELATCLLAAHFHPRFHRPGRHGRRAECGTNVGDVVVGGYAVDKSSSHYELGGHQAPYSGVEIPLTESSDIGGAVIHGYDNAYPVPGDAATYGAGPSQNDPLES